MKEIDYTMRVCPKCKTASIAGDKVCLNCHTHFIYVTERTIGSMIGDALVGGLLAISIYLLALMILDKYQINLFR